MFDYLALTGGQPRRLFPTGLGMNDVHLAKIVCRWGAARATYGFPYGVIYRPITTCFESHIRHSQISRCAQVRCCHLSSQPMT
jgi:hypothetical protein